MKLSRRDWLRLAGTTALAASLPRSFGAVTSATVDFPRNVKPFLHETEQPMFNLPARFKAPVIIESIEMLKRGNNFFVRTRSKDGAVGLNPTKQVEDFMPIFERLVAPQFIGKDARDLE